jgi:CRP-like cAMP-binding protein
MDTALDISHIPVLGGLSNEIARELLTRAQLTTVPAGEPFFRESTPADGFYILHSGQARALKHVKGQDVVLRDLLPHECFGEMSVVDMSPRSATVVALEDCTAWKFSTAELAWLYEQSPEQFTLLQMNIAREISRRLRDTDAHRA